MTHTPGPWNIGPHPGNGAGTAWRQILSQSGPFSPAFVCEAIEPDARLIAAAPDMLAALRSLLNEADSVTIANGGTPGISDRWAAAKAARAAIAKATGA